MLRHFGVNIRENEDGLKLTRENYFKKSNISSFSVKFSKDIYADETGRTYNDEWCENQLRDCLRNYDLNIEFFSLLNHDEFETELIQFMKRNQQFKEVYDLNTYQKKSGYYIMILDEYCQVYIGTTEDIKRRILNHWTKKNPFDRLLFPMGNVDSSIISIDSFRAFDTTRIFAFPTINTYDNENIYINEFSPQYVCNRMAGGKIPGGLIQAIAMMKKRKLG